MIIKTYFLTLPEIENYVLAFVFYDGCLHRLSYLEAKNVAAKGLKENLQPALNMQEQWTIKQFISYFKTPTLKWDIELKWPAVSQFQLSVLDRLKEIPLGKTKTYGEVAAELNTSARAVGNACRRNPFPILIPCHRVVAKTGLGGYDGDKINNSGLLTGRMEIKYFLLRHEGVYL